MGARPLRASFHNRVSLGSGLVPFGLKKLSHHNNLSQVLSGFTKLQRPLIGVPEFDRV